MYNKNDPFVYVDNRGFMTARGQPDQSRSARFVLKDYVTGRLLFCHAPPGHKQEEFHTYPSRLRREVSEEQLPKQQQRAMRVSFKTNSFESIRYKIIYFK